ncbi:hypothetical protein QJS10_CPB17g01038 [Acorus calamus]|uniref:Uncharacterized protein n=1 Tax=Acorus calamus TaxID=4465 RepID=A0AAV9CWV6_ACOCL|nr:hypothetical protein QJS10_CPB17g01038 [Acorus calamus]
MGVYLLWIYFEVLTGEFGVAGHRRVESRGLAAGVAGWRRCGSEPENKSLAEKLQRVLNLLPSMAFGCGDGSVKTLSFVDNSVFTAHQDR